MSELLDFFTETDLNGTRDVLHNPVKTKTKRHVPKTIPGKINKDTSDKFGDFATEFPGIARSIDNIGKTAPGVTESQVLVGDATIPSSSLLDKVNGIKSSVKSGKGFRWSQVFADWFPNKQIAKNISKFFNSKSPIAKSLKKNWNHTRKKFDYAKNIASMSSEFLKTVMDDPKIRLATEAVVTAATGQPEAFILLEGVHETIKSGTDTVKEIAKSKAGKAVSSAIKGINKGIDANATSPDPDDPNPSGGTISGQHEFQLPNKHIGKQAASNDISTVTPHQKELQDGQNAIKRTNNITLVNDDHTGKPTQTTLNELRVKEEELLEAHHPNAGKLASVRTKIAGIVGENEAVDGKHDSEKLHSTASRGRSRPNKTAPRSASLSPGGGGGDPSSNPGSSSSVPGSRIPFSPSSGLETKGSGGDPADPLSVQPTPDRPSVIQPFTETVIEQEENWLRPKYGTPTLKYFEDADEAKPEIIDQLEAAYIEEMHFYTTDEIFNQKNPLHRLNHANHRLKLAGGLHKPTIQYNGIKQSKGGRNFIRPMKRPVGRKWKTKPNPVKITHFKHPTKTMGYTKDRFSPYSVPMKRPTIDIASKKKGIVPATIGLRGGSRTSNGIFGNRRALKW